MAVGRRERRGEGKGTEGGRGGGGVWVREEGGEGEEGSETSCGMCAQTPQPRDRGKTNKDHA